MRFLSRIAATFALAILPAHAHGPAEHLKELGDWMFERELDLAPVLEAYTQGAGPRAHRIPLDLSPDSQERYRKLYSRVLDRLEALPVEALSERDRINYALLKRRASSELEKAAFPMRALYLATPTRNPVNLLVRVGASAQPLATEADFEAWRERLAASAAMFDQAIAQLEAARAENLTTPRALVEATLRQVAPIAAKGAREGPFWGMLARYPNDAPAAKRADFEKRYAETLDGNLLPALRRYEKYLREDYAPKARTSSGIGALPGGDKAYRAAIRGYTTLDLEPSQVHELGLAEVARIRGELLEVARGLGFKGGMKDFAAWTMSHPGNYPFKSGEEVLDYLRKVHARVEPEMPRLFRRLPKARFEIRLTPAAVAASSSATYSRPSADGTRPGIFHIPVVDPRRSAAFSLPALLMHEGMPGHHLDIARMVELDLPRFRKAYSLTVFSEGWGLYAESLGHEVGAYDTPWALLGRYSAELHRAARLVVDTGLHWKGWSREQAIRYLVEERGQAETGATVAVERYMSDPGQALAYKVGELEVRKLRAQAQRELGGKFDIRDFHEVVLGEGALTLDLLGTRVRGWIARTR